MVERPAAPKRTGKPSKKNDVEPATTTTLDGFMNKGAGMASDVVERDDGTMEMDE